MSTTEAFFSILKEHRESKNIQIEEISEYTKINPMYIEAIEEGNFDILPNVYMRLFLRSYAIYLDVDSAKVLEDYELHTTGTIQNKSEFKLVEKEVDNKPSSKTKEQINNDVDITPKKIATIAFVLISIFLVFQLISTISEEQQSNESQSIEKSNQNNSPMEFHDYEKIDTLEQETKIKKQFSALPDLAILNNTNFNPLKKKQSCNITY